ncbi:MAG: Anti-anti-sigma regulatory factor (antagonist of anti-sigma factor)-like protein [Streptosporangiaceae bacterium]|jgi:anti-anti-sigma factor|nr:Anti-anti-sigma regulatory factor (antagonist of anti-sigma factor)-like protein [Streptosporangiaceae bacterium]
MNTKDHHATAGKRVGHAHVDVDLSTIRQPAHTIVRLHGDIDIATAPALREDLLDALGSCTDLLVVDLSGVFFCDAAGLGVLIGTLHRATPRHIDLHLAAPSPQMARLLHITGLDRSFKIHSTLAEALAHPEENRHA